MAEPGSEVRKAPFASVLAGGVLVVAGAAALAWLFYISNSRAPAAEHAMISLGLAGSVLVSALGQGMVIVGVWMLWRVARRPRPAKG